MRITLFQPPLPKNLLLKELYDSGLRFMPLNLAYLGAVLEEKGHKVNIIDLNISMKSITDYVKEDLDKLNSDVIGITGTTNSYFEGLTLANAIKARYPDVIVIMGGCHVTFTAVETLSECLSVDIILRGEGEHVIGQLIEKLEKKQSLYNVPSITYRENGEIRENPKAMDMEDLDKLPFPARHLLPLNLYPRHGIVTSRGCPRKCIFCSAGAMSNGKYRIRSAQNIVSELQLLKGEKNIVFYDNTFSGIPTKSKEICRAIIDANLDITWETELRADSVSPELLDLLVNAGCNAVQFGVESGNENILKEIKKHITTDQIRRAVDISLSRGLEVFCSFTIGHPSDTEETIRETLKLMLELKNTGCNVYPGIVTPYPGTEIFKRKEELGITIHDYNWDYFHPMRVSMSTRYLTKEKLGRLFMEILMAIEPEKFKVGG